MIDIELKIALEIIRLNKKVLKRIKIVSYQLGLENVRENSKLQFKAWILNEWWIYQRGGLDRSNKDPFRKKYQKKSCYHLSNMTLRIQLSEKAQKQARLKSLSTPRGLVLYDLPF